MSKDCFVARFVEEKKPQSRSGSPVPGFTFAPNTWCWRVQSWPGLAIRIPARRCVNQRLGTDSWRVLDSFGSGVRLGVFALPPPLVLNQKPLDNGYFTPSPTASTRTRACRGGPVKRAGCAVAIGEVGVQNMQEEFLPCLSPLTLQ